MKTKRWAMWRRGPLPGLLAGLVVGLLAMGRGAAAPSGGIVFESNWDTATGNSDNALRDGGRWTWHENWSVEPLLTVISGGPGGHNMLRVKQRGINGAENLQVNDFVPLNTDYYVRFYMKTDDTSPSRDHIVTVDTWEYPNLTYMSKWASDGGWEFLIAMEGCSGYTYPIGHWMPGITLMRGQWYRFEYAVDFLDPTHIQVHPRVYDEAGTLLFSDINFKQTDYGSASWNGRNDWTLASYYASGYNFCVDPGVAPTTGGHKMTNFALGNNGQYGSADTGLYWYFAGVQLRTDTWPGPVSGGGSDTTAPSIPTMNTPTVISASQINLSWTASTDTGGSGLAGYHLERCQGSTCTTFTEIASIAAPATSYPNTGLTANTTYRYRVRAADAAGLLSGYSAMVSATTLAASAFDFSLANGGNRTVTPGQLVTNTITATLVSGTAQAVTFTVTGLPSGTTYAYNPTSCSPTCTTTKTITTSASTPTGTYPITVTATGGGLTRTTSFTLTVSAPVTGGGIAARYPGDVGIETDPAVVFVERFEDSVTAVGSRWGDVLNSADMTLDPDVPAGSPGTRSLNLTVPGGANDASHLYKNLAAAGLAQNDTLYLRYYIKYPVGNNAAHSGIWLGGYNPPLDYPFPQAGVQPTGNDRFHAATEDMVQDGHTYDHYDYWMGMHPDGWGAYWGNVLLNDPSVTTPLGQWLCVEQMVKLNTPVTALNGEHAIWLNGTQVSHLGPGFPHGSWSGGRFVQDPSVVTTFEGFQWRNTTALNLTYLWLQNFNPNTPGTTLKFDHVVAATSYIGCLATSPSCLKGDLDCSGKVDLDDLRRMIYMLIGTVPTDLSKADLDGDGQLLLVDLQILVRILVGLP